MAEDEAYDALRAYTLTLGDADFLHQHVVDVYAAQHADAGDKPIQRIFALAGLNLFLEKGFSGRQVQKVHMHLANRRGPWPTLPLPARRSALTAADVLATAPGAERRQAVQAWCVSVWSE